MKKQIGNDVRLEWTILRKGVVEDFTDATDLLLTAFIPNLSVDEVTIPIARVGNVFTLNIPTTDLSIGTYTIRLQYKKPDPAFVSGKASISTAVNGAFQVVPIGASEDDLNDELTSNVVYCTDGATFIPSVSLINGEAILSWTNDKGYVNPDPVNIKGNTGESVYDYYLASTTDNPPLTEAEYAAKVTELSTTIKDAIGATSAATGAASVAINAASSANSAASNANNAANTVTQAAEDADAAALLANTAADNANTKAIYAQTQGDYAKAQGDYAKLKGDYAHEQGLAAYTAANQANATNDSVQAAENLRVSAESSRVTAESNRVSQENDRINAENIRVSNEDDRISAESARVTAESGRVTAENGRVTAENDREANVVLAVANANNAAITANTAAINANNAADAVGDIIENITANYEALLYLNSGNTLTPIAPTTNITYSIALNGTTPTVFSLTFTTTEASFVSKKATYNPAFYVRNLNTNVVYTVLLEWLIGTTKIVEASQSVRASGSDVLFIFPLNNNLLSDNISYSTGQVFTLRATISKEGVSAETIEVYSSATRRSCLKRNGGAIGSGEIMDFNGINLNTQTQRNRSYDSALKDATYIDRVLFDGGSIIDKVVLKSMYDDALNLLPNTDLWYNLECGIKTRVSGLNSYVVKVYDLSTNNRDASQTTEASQPYLVSNINPANRLAIWGLSRLLPLASSVAKITTDKWTIAVNVKALGGLCEFIGSTNTRLSVTTAATDSVTFKNESGTSVSLNLLSKIVGTSARLYFVAKGDGTMQVWLNGVLQGTLSNPTNATFANLYGSANGELKAIRLFNKDLNKSEIEFLDAKMAAYYPPFEGVTIGNQVWEASNAMDTIAPDGTVIPQVTMSNNSAELIINESDRTFAVDTGFWNKNGNAVIANGACSIINASVGASGINANILELGKVYELSLFIYNTTAPINILFGNSSSVSIQSPGAHTIQQKCTGDTILRVYGTQIGQTFEMDNFSLKEVGWAALTTPAWCYYDNNEANGAVYGRIYNGYAIQKLTGSPIWRASMSADFTQLSAFLGGNAVAGGKMKAEGLTYWGAPNNGATNESGFTVLGGGIRLGSSGGFSSLRFENYYWGGDGYILTIPYISTASAIITSDIREGMSLRRLRRVPPGDLVREITSGVFTTNITGGTFKDIAVPNMYRITGVKVTSAQALTNFTLEARTASGVLVQNLLSGKSIGAGKSIIFSVVADMEVMLQDYIARATAIGNGGAGMEIELIIEKIKV